MVEALHAIVDTPLAVGASATNYFSVGAGGNLFADTTEANKQVIFHAAGTLSRLAIGVTVNATTGGTNTVRSRINAGNGALTFTVATGAGSIGIFEDVTNSDTIADGDKLAISVTAGTGGNLTVGAVQTVFAATTNTVSQLVANGSLSFSASTAAAYSPIAGGWSSSNATETFMKTQARRAGTIKRLGVHLSANSTNANANFVINTVSALVTVSVTGNSGAGFFEDTINTESVAIGDDLDYKFSDTRSVGTLTLTSVWCELETTTNYGMMVCGFVNGFSISKGLTRFMGVSGALYQAGGESAVQVKPYYAFTFSDITFMISAVSAATCTASLRKNTSSVGINETVTSTASVGGRYTDTTHTDVVATTDLINIQFVTSAPTGTNATVITNYGFNTFLASAAASTARPRTQAINLSKYLGMDLGGAMTLGVGNQGGVSIGILHKLRKWLDKLTAAHRSRWRCR